MRDTPQIPGTAVQPDPTPEHPVRDAADPWLSPAFEPSEPSIPARSSPSAGGRPVGSIGRGSIVLIAILAAALSAGGTLGIVELIVPPSPAASSATAVLAATSGGTANQPIVHVAAAAVPAVVTITASGAGGFGRGAGTSIGSGMLVTSDG